MTINHGNHLSNDHGTCGSVAMENPLPLLEGQLWKTPSILSYPLIIKDRIGYTWPAPWLIVFSLFVLLCMFLYAVEYADMYQVFVNGWLVTASDEMMMLKWLNVSKCAKPFLIFWIPLNDAQVLIFIPKTGWVEVLQPTQLSIFVKTQAFHQHFDPKSTPVGRLSPAASTSEGGPGSHLERGCCGRWRVLGFSIYVYLYIL